MIFCVSIYTINSSKLRTLSRAGLYEALFGNGDTQGDEDIDKSDIIIKKGVEKTNNAKFDSSINERHGWGLGSNWGKQRRRHNRKKPKEKKTVSKPQKRMRFDKSCSCGISKDLLQVSIQIVKIHNIPPKQRIVGGVISVKNNWPWMATLEDNFGNHYCGGSIISSRYN